MNGTIDDKLRQSIVALVRHKDEYKEILGTGFFISNDGSLITCAHVVQEEGTDEIPEDELIAVFNKENYPVEYLRIHPDPEVLDVAILRLKQKELPSEAILLPLGKWKSVSRQRDRFRTFGFKTPDYFNGLYATGEIRGHVEIRESGASLLQLEPEVAGAQEIRPGMSGAPVYDKETDYIVGMITFFFRQGEEETIPFAIPIEEIADIWSLINKRLVEEELLQQFLKVFRIGEWFTEKSLKSFYNSLPIPNLVEYDELDEDNKLQTLIEELRVKAQGRIYDLINCLRDKRPDIPLAQLIELPPVHRINFVNREDELKEACGRYAIPYIFFEAPAGYGKTELLKAIEQRHFRDNWLCIYVETLKSTNSAIDLANQISRQAGCSDLSSLPDASAVGYRLAGFLENRIKSLRAPGLVLLIDSVEKLPKKEIDTFLNHFLIALQSGTQELRVRFAGRYIGSLWEEYAKNFELTVKPLTPFRFKYVKDTVRFLFPAQNVLDLRAAHLMDITGGHPGCMAEIMKQINFEQPVEEHFQETQNKYYEDIVLPVANEIRNSIPEDLQNIFDVLSVFRRYNYRLLQKIIDAGLIEYEGGADSLEKALTATYLVKRRNGFIQDEIVRRLLAIRLRWEEPVRFIELCEKAKEIYKQDLQQSITSRRAEFIAIEGLYQELQLSYYQGAQTLEARQTLCDRFFVESGILHQYFELLAAKPDAVDIIKDLITLLEDGDWEFRFVVNFFLRGENQYNDDPYDQMLDQIKTFFTQRGGKNA